MSNSGIAETPKMKRFIYKSLMKKEEKRTAQNEESQLEVIH